MDRIRRDELESLGAVDAAVHRVVQTLRGTDELRNTLIVFTSDNGVQLGEHRLRGKEAPYEESIRVPMVMRFDALMDGEHAAQRLVLNIDLAPTFAALAGVELGSPDGRSLVPLLRHRSPPWRKAFLIEHVGERIPTYCAVRTRGWKYVYYVDGTQELYELARDPYELENVIDRPSLEQRVKRLHGRLRALCRPAPPGMAAAV